MTTDQQIKARCKQFTEEESSDYDCRQFSLSAIESLYREALAKGLEMAADIANGGGFITDTSAEARFGRECASAIRRKATRVKDTPCDTSDLDRW